MHANDQLKWSSYGDTNEMKQCKWNNAYENIWGHNFRVWQWLIDFMGHFIVYFGVVYILLGVDYVQSGWKQSLLRLMIIKVFYILYGQFYFAYLGYPKQT